MSSTPLPSSTIIIARNNTLEKHIEIFMVVRHHQIDFAAGALVFPGGKVSAHDYDLQIRDHCSGHAPDDEKQLALQVAAIREAYEESGILLARNKIDASLVNNRNLEKFHPYRTMLQKNVCSMAEFMIKENLILALDTLHHFAHWITPSMMPKRFDTHFYLAQAPMGQLGFHDGSESVDSLWISPQQALQRADEGSLKIIFPTRMNLMRLAQYASVEAAIEDTLRQPVVSIMPWTEEKPAGVMLCIPENAGYEVTEVPIEVVMRS